MRPILRGIFERVGPKILSEPLLYYAEDLTDFIENKDKVQRTKTLFPSLSNNTYLVIIEDIIVEGLFFLDKRETRIDNFPHTELRDKKTFLQIAILPLTMQENVIKLESKKPHYFCKIVIIVGFLEYEGVFLYDIEFFDTPQKKRKQPKFEELEANKLNWGKLQPIPIHN